MSGESVDQKGARLVREGRVRVVKASHDEYWGTCIGDSGTEYIVTCLPGRGFVCECESRVPCSHISASQESWLIAMGGAQ